MKSGGIAGFCLWRPPERDTGNAGRGHGDDETVLILPVALELLSNEAGRDTPWFFCRVCGGILRAGGLREDGEGHPKYSFNEHFF